MSTKFQHDGSSDDGSDQSVSEKTGDEENGTDTCVLWEVASLDYLRRKFYCSVCPKRYWSVTDLRTHMRSHTGEVLMVSCVLNGLNGHVLMLNAIFLQMYICGDTFKQLFTYQIFHLVVLFKGQ